MVLIASSLAVVLSFVPQDPGGSQPRVVGVDENGWPVFADGGETKQPSPDQVAEKATSESLPPRGEAGEGASSVAVLPAAAPRRQDELAEIFARVGSVGAFEALAGVAAHCRLTVLDDRGAVVGARDWLHEADVRHGALRDRLALPDRRVHGRDGERVFASLHGLRLSSEEGTAREQLELFGTLLRAPWCFADAARYELVQSRDVRGVQPVRELEFRPVVADDATPPGERYVLRCAADTMQPLGLRYRLAPRRWREVRFADWRQVEGIQLPYRIEWLDLGGTVTTAWTLEELSVGHRFPERQFRPLR